MRQSEPYWRTAWERLQKPLMPKAWLESRTKTNMEWWPWYLVLDEINESKPTTESASHPWIVPQSPWNSGSASRIRNPSPRKSCPCQGLQSAFPMWGHYQECEPGARAPPTSVILGLGTSCAPSPGELHLARSCGLLLPKLFPSTIGPLGKLMEVREEPSSAVKLGIF